MKKSTWIACIVVALWVVGAFVVGAFTHDDNSCPVRAGQSATDCIDPNGADLGNGNEEDHPPEGAHPRPIGEIP